MTAPAPPPRGETWLALLRRLASSSPHWLVHGDVGEGFAAEGDVDLVAPGRDLPAVQEVFEGWAAQEGLGPVVACRHRAGVLVLVALGAPDEPFFELEVRYERHFRGGLLWRAEDLARFGRDQDGYRALRPGAAGLLKLIPNGLAPGGRPAWAPPKRARVAARLAADPPGVAAAADLFGSARAAAGALAATVVAGTWDRRAALVLEGWALARAPTRPVTLVRRGVFRARAGRRCAVLAAVRAGRTVSGDRAQWLGAVAATHRVSDARGAAAPP